MAPEQHLSRLDVEHSLPSLPVVALDVLTVCGDPESTAADLADVLSRDPVLTAQVLQVANSAFYYRGNPVTSLHRAAMVLGTQALKVVALGFTLANEMPRRGRAAGLDLPAYWHRSLLNAVLARALAWSLEQEVAEEALPLWALLGAARRSQTGARACRPTRRTRPGASPTSSRTRRAETTERLPSTRPVQLTPLSGARRVRAPSA